MNIRHIGIFSILFLLCLSPGNTFAFETNNPTFLFETSAVSLDEDIRVSTNTLPTTITHSEMEVLKHEPKKDLEEKRIRDYYITTGGTLPIYDEDFREFLDYGASVTIGMRQQIKEQLFLNISLDLTMLNGTWMSGESKEITQVYEELYFPGYVPEPGYEITSEDLPEENLGAGYHSEGEAIITSSELLRTIDVDTTLFILPITVGAMYWIHEGGKVNPYVGGGLGFCLARRECVSDAVKEQVYEGPQYRLELDDSQLITGMLFQLYAGVQIPLVKNLKLVAEGNTTLYDLKQFDPILEISYKTNPPPWNYVTTEVTTFSYENPQEFGVFKEEYVTNLSIGIVMPF